MLPSWINLECDQTQKKGFTLRQWAGGEDLVLNIFSHLNSIIYFLKILVVTVYMLINIILAINIPIFLKQIWEKNP